jgi:pyridoxamine 5'-phosphate oxidase
MIEWVEELRAGFTAEFGTGPKVVTLATVETERVFQPSPRVRSVVCRRLDADGRLLVAIDERSRKTGEVAHRQAAEVCAWLPAVRRQFRLFCEAGLVRAAGTGDRGGLREQLWTELSESSRALFFWPHPGAPRREADAAFPPAVRTGLPPENFALVSLAPIDVDLLELAGHPHRRRRWRLDETGWSVQELNP